MTVRILGIDPGNELSAYDPDPEKLIADAEENLAMRAALEEFADLHSSAVIDGRLLCSYCMHRWPCQHALILEGAGVLP